MRAQGLPLTTIVAAVLALLLVFFIFAFVFNIGGISNIFADLLSGGQAGMSTAAFQNECELACFSASNFDSCNIEPDFCTKTADTSEDGGVESDTCYNQEASGDVYKHCVVTDICGNSIVLNDECGSLPYGSGCCS